MATRTFTNGGVDNLWSTAGNWDTPPVDNDAVVIAAGQTCEYDIDNSAWANGIAGLTITGTLKLTRTAGTYYLKMKSATNIAGAGTFDCGASGDAIPFAAKHTISGVGNWRIYGNNTLTFTVYAAEPTYKYVTLTAPAIIGATVLSVDTDVTGDIWADGDTIAVCATKLGNSSVQETTIAAGGIAAGTITLSAGLIAARSVGAVIVLVTRNVRFAFTNASANYPLSGFNVSSKMQIAGGQFHGNANECFAGIFNTNITGGIFYNFASVISANTLNNTFSGGVVICKCNVTLLGNRITITGGLYAGLQQLFYIFSNHTITGGIFTNCSLFANSGLAFAVSGGTYTYIATVFSTIAGAQITGGTFNNNTQIGFSSVLKMNNISLTNSSTADIYQSTFSAFNVLFGSATENYLYGNLPKEFYSESIDHDQVAGAFRSWTAGGVTSSQAVTVPVGYTKAMQTVLENAAVEGYWQKEYTVGAGASVNITMNLRKSASMTYLPRCIIFNKASTDPFAGGAGINTFTMTDSIDTWEASTYTYYNSTAEDVTLVVRFQGMNASGNMFSALLVEQINVDLTAVLAALAVVDGNVDAIKLSTDNLPADPADESLLEAAIAAIAINYTSVADAVHDEAFEGAITFRELERLILSLLAGKATGGGTATIAFRDQADSKNRVLLTVNPATGDRSGTVVDLS